MAISQQHVVKQLELMRIGMNDNKKINPAIKKELRIDSGKKLMNAPLSSAHSISVHNVCQLQIKHHHTLCDIFFSENLQIKQADFKYFPV